MSLLFRFLNGVTQFWLIHSRGVLSNSFGNSVSSESLKDTRNLQFPKSLVTRPFHRRWLQNASTLLPDLNFRSISGGEVAGAGEDWQVLSRKSCGNAIRICWSLCGLPLQSAVRTPRIWSPSVLALGFHGVYVYCIMFLWTRNLKTEESEWVG